LSFSFPGSISRAVSSKKNGEGAVVEHPREFSREYHSKLFD